MVKKIISVATAFLMLCCMIPFGVFADDVLEDCPKCGEHTYTKLQDFSMSTEDFSFPIAIKKRYCSSCNYAYYDWNCLGITGYKEFDDGGYNLLVDYLREWANNTFGQNATATKAPTGIGRKDLPGYSDEKGTPAVDTEGYPTATYTMLLDGYDTSAGCDTVNVHSTTNNTNPGSWYAYTNGSFSGSNGNVSAYGIYDNSNNNFVMASVSYYFVAPVSGYYTITSPPVKYITIGKDSKGNYQYNTSDSGLQCFYWFGVGVSSSSWKSGTFTPTKSTSSITKKYSSYTIYAKKGDYLFASFSGSSYNIVDYSCPYKYISIQTSAPTLTVQDLKPTQIQNNNTITINNNTWNGNIYVDNSNNLTYIYPQYTTINENGDTITNISTNPIIYNNTTNQYYTYDTVTNNYYYITYEEPTPSPSPSPDTPSGGDTSGILAVLVEIRDNMIQGFADFKAALAAGFADLSANFTLAIENLTINIQNFFSKGMSGSPVDPNIPGGGSGTISTPETGGKDDSGGSGWNWNPLKWLTDLLKDIVEKILKAIWKLLTSIFGFILWLLSLVGQLLPFIPAQAVLALTAGAVIVTIIRIIKFITGR